MKKLCLVPVAALTLSACATTPDPAKVCTAEWIKPRTEKAVSAIEKDTRGVIKNLRKVALSYADGKKPGPLTMWSLSNSVKKLESELESGRGIRDLRTLARTCDDPKIVSSAMAGFLRSHGLPDGLVRFIESLDDYQKILSPEFGRKETT